MGKPAMDCKKIKEDLYLFSDGEMEDELKKSFEKHLAYCPGCARRLAFTRRFLIIVRERCIRMSAPVTLRRRILTKLKIRIRDDWH